MGIEVPPTGQTRPARSYDHNASGISNDRPFGIDAEHCAEIDHRHEVPVCRPVEYRPWGLTVHARHDQIATREQRLIPRSDELRVALDSEYEAERARVARGDIHLVRTPDVVLRSTRDAGEFGRFDKVSVEEHKLANSQMRELQRDE